MLVSPSLYAQLSRLLTAVQLRSISTASDTYDVHPLLVEIFHLEHSSTPLLHILIIRQGIDI
jgi:hypothetical protein